MSFHNHHTTPIMLNLGKKTVMSHSSFSANYNSLGSRLCSHSTLHRIVEAQIRDPSSTARFADDTPLSVDST